MPETTPTTEQQPAEVAPEATQQAPEPTNDTSQLPEWAQAELRKVRTEAANYRTKLREAEPVVAKYRELEESQKSEAQRLAEAQVAAERARDEAIAESLRLRIAIKHGIGEEDFDLLGSGTEEQLTARAERIAAKNAAAQSQAPAAPPVPRTDRPVEQLRPGATPTEVPLGEQDAYPAHWLPSRAQQT